MIDSAAGPPVIAISTWIHCRQLTSAARLDVVYWLRRGGVGHRVANLSAAWHGWPHWAQLATQSAAHRGATDSRQQPWASGGVSLRLLGRLLTTVIDRH